MTPVLETERLLLQPLRMEDAARSQQLFPHWEIVKFLNARVPWPFPDDGVLKYYREAVFPGIERGDEWHWTIRLKESPDDHIGVIEVRKGEETNRGFWMGLPWQGRGFMTEAAVAATDFWFDELRFPALRVAKAIANTASRRISERTEMRVIATVERDYVAGRLPTEIWEITAEEWRGKRRSTGRHRAKAQE